MRHRVLDTLPVEENTSVTIEGRGEGLKSGITVFGADGAGHRLISVALMCGLAPEEIGKATTVLAEGEFKSDIMQV